MKLKMIALAALAATPLLGNAQPPRAGFMQIDKLAVLLDLDESQKSEVARILESVRPAERPTGLSREERQTIRETHKAAVLSQLSGVLNESQIEKFEILTERPQRGRGRGPGARDRAEL